MRLSTSILVGLLASIAMVSGARAAPARAPAVRELPDDWYPESLAAGPDGSLYVGSWRQGAVARLKPDGSAPEILVKPGANGLANAQGVLIDAREGLLWVCSGNLGHTTVPATPSALKSYDLKTGAPRGNYVLPDAGYCNDIVQSADGRIFVTDSYHPRILVLRKGRAQLEIWLEDKALGMRDAAFTLNGIALDGRGGLYVSPVMAADYIFHIDGKTDGSAGDIQRVPAPRVLHNVDALRRLDSRHLVLFESNAFGDTGPYGGAITLATLDNGSISELRPLVAGLNDPSSGLILNGRVWYIESKYGLLLHPAAGNAAVPLHVPFDVRSVPLPE